MRRRPPLRTLLLSAMILAAEGVAAADLEEFARCLNQAGATYYTAAWCPHCAKQNQMFGDALGSLRSVDCTRGCAGVRSFPTWEFADGARVSGVLSFEVLESRTGCRLEKRKSQPRDTEWTRSAAGGGSRERYIGGARIIEVPGR